MVSTFTGIPVLYNLVGIGLALIFSLATANNNRRYTVILPLSNYSSFIHKFRKQVLDMGYESLDCQAYEMKFVHPFKLSYYNSDILVKLSFDCVIIIGPKKTINYLKIGS